MTSAARDPGFPVWTADRQENLRRFVAAGPRVICGICDTNKQETWEQHVATPQHQARTRIDPAGWPLRDGPEGA